jgi:hypothetical protein
LATKRLSEDREELLESFGSSGHWRVYVALDRISSSLVGFFWTVADNLVIVDMEVANGP